jgi:nucleoside phosphorylase
MCNSYQSQIQKTLLGRLSNDIHVVVITPIISAFNKLKEKLNASEVNESGFFSNTCFQTKNGLTGMLVCIPQGIGAQDVMHAFSNVNVLFYGYAGSLVDDIKIGSIVEIGTAIDTEMTIFPLRYNGTYDQVICGYSPCLLGDIANRHCEQARLAGCQVIDMETVYCAYAATKNSNRFTAHLVISDIPGTINFWELTADDKAYFKKKCASAIDNMVLLLNSYEKE